MNIIYQNFQMKEYACVSLIIAFQSGEHCRCTVLMHFSRNLSHALETFHEPISIFFKRTVLYIIFNLFSRFHVKEENLQRNISSLWLYKNIEKRTKYAVEKLWIFLKHIQRIENGVNTPRYYSIINERPKPQVNSFQCHIITDRTLKHGVGSSGYHGNFEK